jgi:hypothetical protein
MADAYEYENAKLLSHFDRFRFNQTIFFLCLAFLALAEAPYLLTTIS